MIFLTYLFILIATAILAAVGAFVFRARGGWPPIPRPIEQAFFALPLLVIGLQAWGIYGILPYVAIVLYIVSTAAILRGHGRNADLGQHKEPADLEWYEHLPPLRWLEKRLPPYWYDVSALAVSGLSYTIAMLPVSPLIALSGIAKAPAFMVGKLIADHTSWQISLFGGKFYVKSAWEWGEFLCGAFLWLLWSAYILVKMLL